MAAHGGPRTESLDEAAPPPVVAVVEALYDYTAQEPNCINLVRGAIVYVVEKHDSGWWDGVCSGHRGWFPSNFVRAVDLAAGTPAPPPPEQQLQPAAAHSTSTDSNATTTWSDDATARTTSTGPDPAAAYSPAHAGSADPRQVLRGTDVRRRERPMSIAPTSAEVLQSYMADGTYTPVATTVASTKYPAPRAPNAAAAVDAQAAVPRSPLNSNHELQRQHAVGSAHSIHASNASISGSIGALNQTPTSAHPATQPAAATAGSAASTINLPPNWRARQTADGQVYYYNTVSNETRWSMTGHDRQHEPAATAEPGHEEEGMMRPRKDSNLLSSMMLANPAPAVPVVKPPVPTWESLIAGILVTISHLNDSAKLGDKVQYTVQTQAIVQAVHDMLLSSGTTSKNARALANNVQLKSYHHQLLSSVAKLMLAARVASGVWPPPDAVNRMRHQAGQVLLAIRHFVSAAQDAQLKLTPIPDRSAPSSAATTAAPPSATSAAPGGNGTDDDFDVSSVHLTDVALVSKLDKEGEAIQLQLTSVSSRVVTDHAGSPELVSLTRDAVVKVGQLLSLLEDFRVIARPDDVSMASLVSDFRSRKDALYAWVNDLVTAVRTIMDEFAPPNALQFLATTSAVVQQGVADLITAVKLIIEEKALFEQSVLQGQVTMIEDHKRDSDLSILQRRAMSLNFLSLAHTSQGGGSNGSLSLMPDTPVSGGLTGMSTMDRDGSIGTGNGTHGPGTPTGTLHPQGAGGSHHQIHHHHAHSSPGIHYSAPHAGGGSNAGTLTIRTSGTNGSLSDMGNGGGEPASSIATAGSGAPPISAPAADGTDGSGAPAAAKVNLPPRTVSSSSHLGVLGFSERENSLDRPARRVTADFKQRVPGSNMNASSSTSSLDSTKLTKFFGENATVLNRSKDREAAAAAAGKKWYLDHDYAPGDLTLNMEGQVSGGTLAALVERLTLHDSTIDTTFLQAFLLTFRAFTTPDALLHQLALRFTLPCPEGLAAAEEDEWRDRKQTPIRLRVFNVLKTWLDVYYQDAADDACLTPIQQFATVVMEPVLPQPAKRILELVQRRVANLGVGTPVARAVPRSRTTSHDPSGNFNASSSSLGSVSGSVGGSGGGGGGRNGAAPPPIMPRLPIKSFMDIDPLELARQLTIIEGRMLAAIQPFELLNQDFSKKNQPVALHVKAMVNFSTQLSSWVAESILHDSEPKKRCSVIKFWLKTADKTHSLNNFSSLKSIIGALDSSTVARLSKTWDLLPDKHRHTLETLRAATDHSRNFAAYRAVLKTIVPPCVPFLGMYLTDLTFIHDGNPEFRGADRKLINFDKYLKTARTVFDLLRFQAPSMGLAEVQEVQEVIQEAVRSTKTKGNPDELYRLSLILEPRVASPSS
ncbi:Ras guanine nucleotide exchange factor bud5 [Blastocladiella emersonii ATCC 22665]|nr:Ras guanine nucleotide exchange factor bud5 [Blastocladiella emersonii ATCC 22665]